MRERNLKMKRLFTLVTYFFMGHLLAGVQNAAAVDYRCESYVGFVDLRVKNEDKIQAVLNHPWCEDRIKELMSVGAVSREIDDWENLAKKIAGSDFISGDGKEDMRWDDQSRTVVRIYTEPKTNPSDKTYNKPQGNQKKKKPKKPTENPNEKKYMELYAWFLQAQMCYEGRRGYAVVYINDVQWERATSNFERKKSALGVSMEKIKAIESKVDKSDIAVLWKLASSAGMDYTAQGKQDCAFALLALNM